MIKNNKGQTLVIFVVLLPLLVLFLAFMIDTSLMYMNNNKLNNLTKYIINYGLDNIDKSNIEESLENLIIENDKEVNIDEIKIENSIITITLKKKNKSMFGNIIQKEEYEMVSKYIGTISNGKKEIKKG